MRDEMPKNGVVLVAVTPFDESGAVDEASLHSLVEFAVESGCRGIAVLGVMGEADRMTDREARLVIDVTLRAASSRVPVIAGISSPALARVVELGRFAAQAGCAGVLLQPMPGLRGADEISGYFEAAAAAIGPDVPICVQDLPRANGVHVSVEAWRAIVERCPSVVMLKHEDEPGLTKLSEIRRAETEGTRAVTILVGNNGILLPEELRRGADGAMTGFAFPDALNEVIEMLHAGRLDEGMDVFARYLPINRYEYATGISVRKEILRRRGVIASAVTRYPARPVDTNTAAELDRLLARLEQVTGVAISQIAGGA